MESVHNSSLKRVVLLAITHALQHARYQNLAEVVVGDLVIELVRPSRAVGDCFVVFLPNEITSVHFFGQVQHKLRTYVQTPEAPIKLLRCCPFSNSPN